MRLTKVTIEGYRSIRDRMDLFCDAKVTVVLGANDHGKTNLLEALSHLNEDAAFSGDSDLNWDRSDKPSLYPKISFIFDLNSEDKEKLSEDYKILSLTETLPTALAEKLATYHSSKVTRDNHQSDLGAAVSRIEALEQEIPEITQAIQETSNDEALRESLATMTDELQQQVQSRTAIEAELREAEALVDQTHHELLNLGAATIAIRAGQLRDIEAAIMAGREATATTYLTAEQAKNEASEAFQAAQKALEEAKPSGEEERIKKLQAAANRQAESLNIATHERDREKQHFELAEEIVEAWAADVLKPDDVIAHFTLELPEVPDRVVIERVGIGNNRSITADDCKNQELLDLIQKRIPRVEIFAPVERFQDRADRESIDSEGQEFMRGVFYYSGLERERWDALFHQDPTTTKALADASVILNRNLKKNWSQGQELKFCLLHDSKAGKIDLFIEDPSVERQYVQPTRRSAGFTHFFTLKTVLHARQQEHPAYSYLWIFDEPGIHLHPHAQSDLMQVFETIGQESQVVYSTHSIFMANRNYPLRHRLLIKNRDGTHLDTKPYRGRWKAVLAALGSGLPGTVFFADKVLLVEGDSDVTFIYSLLQKLIENGLIEFDINGLAIVAMGEARDGVALIQMFMQSPNNLSLAVLLDGDEGGAKREKIMKRIMKKYNVKCKMLDEGTTIEDHLIGIEEIYVPAVGAYVAELGDKKLEHIMGKLKEEFVERWTDAEQGISGVGNWSRGEGAKIAGLEEEPSAVGIARQYANALVETTWTECEKKRHVERAKRLADWIGDVLKLPRQTLEEEKILEVE